MNTKKVSVEDLNLWIRDPPASPDGLAARDTRQVLQNPTGTIHDIENTISPARESSQNAAKQILFHSNPIKKHSTLPSICLKKTEKRSNELAQSRGLKHSAEGPAVMDPYKMLLNVNSLDNVVTGNDDYLQPVNLQTEQKSGKKLLAPLVAPKQSSQRVARERTNSSPEISIPNIKHMTPKDYTKNPGQLNAGVHDFTDVQKQRAHTHDGLLKRPTESLPAGPSNISEERNFLEIPQRQQRRFSAPLSPRFVRRLIPEKIYSSSELKTSENRFQEQENHQRFPERGSIFSPPAKEFHEIESEGTKLESHDLDYNSNPTRFLSDVKVTFTENIGIVAQPKVRNKGDKRKNSYSALSAYGEALLSNDMLPPVRTSMPEYGSRSRAHSTSGLSFIPSTSRSELAKSTFDSPIFLDPGTQRLSHLSLSPRLPRKF